MNNRYKALAVLAGVVLVLAIGAQQLLSTPAVTPQQNGGAQFGPPPVSVEVAGIIEKEVSASVSLVGSVKAFRQAMVSAEVPGKVIAFDKREGASVTKDETVALLDGAIYKIIVRETQNRLKEAKTELAKVKLTQKRAAELYAQNIGSLEAKQNAELDVDLARSKVNLRQAELERALYDQANLNIKAPFGGFITGKQVEEGYWVEKGGNLFEIVDTHKVEVITEAPERLMSAVASGKEVAVTFDALPGMEFAGNVAALVPKVNQNTRTFPIRIVMDNPEHKILAGMFARIKIPTTGKQTVLLVPRDAVVLRSNKAIVYAIEGPDTVREKAITLGRQHGERVEVTGDISVDEKLVVTGNEILQDGQKVIVLGGKQS